MLLRCENMWTGNNAEMLGCSSMVVAADVCFACNIKVNWVSVLMDYVFRFESGLVDCWLI